MRFDFVEPGADGGHTGPSQDLKGPVKVGPRKLRLLVHSNCSFIVNKNLGVWGGIQSSSKHTAVLSSRG
eukprot:3576815-Pyramimonas_sp.AAC.1